MELALQRCRVGAAVVPSAARAMCDSAPGVADDPRLFDLAESAVIKIRNVRKLDRLTQSKWEKCREGLPAGWAVDGPTNAEFERRAEAGGDAPACLPDDWPLRRPA